MEAMTVVLDRDGVILRDRSDYITAPDHVELLPGALRALSRLSDVGARVFVVTNQSVIQRGLGTWRFVEQTHAWLRSAVEAAGGRVEGFLVCPHLPSEGCDCRKPKPGLLRRLESEFGVALRGGVLIGDHWTDIAAGRAVGMRTILVRSGRGCENDGDLADHVATDVDEASSFIDRAVRGGAGWINTLT
jgi:D-glycero-D-manno-heptose 1,7-bisphosphate phosphatase